jgi:hypothetical protein
LSTDKTSHHPQLKDRGKKEGGKRDSNGWHMTWRGKKESTKKKKPKQTTQPPNHPTTKTNWLTLKTERKIRLCTNKYTKKR